MEFSSVLNFLENKAILVTGGAGFLAKVFTEKVLRSQPKLKKVYLLLRADDNKAASLRLQNEVLGKDLFKVLKQKMGPNFNSFISEKMKVVRGDIILEDLAIEDLELNDELYREIDVIVNLAANTNFDERYDVSLWLNTFGAKNVLDFAKKCRNLKVLIQVSTAYVSGETEGLIKEVPYDMGESLNGRHGLNIDVEKKLVKDKLEELQSQGIPQDVIRLTMKDLGSERAKHWGWPNVYVFTKALGEMLLSQEKEDVPLVFLRPTVVTSTFKEPMPGWIEGVKTVDVIAVAYGKGRLPRVAGDPNSVADMIPADMVVNAMIVAAMTHANDKGNLTIYHVGSSVKNPVNFGSLCNAMSQFFKQHPFVNKKDGIPIVVDQLEFLDSMASFNTYLSLHYLLPLEGLEVLNKTLFHYFEEICKDMRKNINSLIKMIEIYRPYLFYKAIYDDTNTEKLRIASRERGDEEGEKMFYFDPNVIDWNDYLVNTHFTGLVKYALNRVNNKDKYINIIQFNSRL